MSAYRAGMAGAVLAVSFACGGGNSGKRAPPSGAAGTPSTEPAGGSLASGAHAALPQVVDCGGPVMTEPRVVAISFAGDALAAGIDRFLAQLASASYWSAATSEYGVGSLSLAAPIHAGETPPANLDDTGVQAWLASKLESDPQFPQPDTNTLYTLFYPNGVSVTADGNTGCRDFVGYHRDFQLANGSEVVYAVVLRCSSPGSSASPMDLVSSVASHELVEAATDPLSVHAPGWCTLDQDDLGWELVTGGGEIADACGVSPGVLFRPAGMDNLVQRVWSNRQAAADHDPCQPEGKLPYFNAAPRLSDLVSINDPLLGAFTARGVQIPVGTRKTIQLDLFSDQPSSGPWAIEVLDLASTLLGEAPALSFALDRNQGQAGDRVFLTIQVIRARPSGAAPFLIHNVLGTNGTTWPGVVGG